MKCIDTIEGMVKSILSRMHAMSVENRLDDSEYIRNAKTIIEATDLYVLNNPELVEDPQLLKQVLYIHSRNLWLTGQAPAGPEATRNETIDYDAEEYQTYYYDYVYSRGLYPR
jgi:hypothetical protein